MIKTFWYLLWHIENLGKVPEKDNKGTCSGIWKYSGILQDEDIQLLFSWHMENLHEHPDEDIRSLTLAYGRVGNLTDNDIKVLVLAYISLR